MGRHRQPVVLVLTAMAMTLSQPALVRTLGRHAPRRLSRMGVMTTGQIQAGCLSQSEVLLCSTVQDWLHPQCSNYRGFLVKRPLLWGHVQEQVDGLAASGVFGRDEQLQEVVGAESPKKLQEEISAVARGLAQPLVSKGLPEKVAQQIQADAAEVGVALSRLLPTVPRLEVKLEVIGENCCKRWHTDRNVARAIVTYNGRGTAFAENSNVNLWELEHCGKNEHIIRDETQVFHAEAADVLLIKGSAFPAGPASLVHKSPQKRYHPNGEVMHRLCLKIDVPATKV